MRNIKHIVPFLLFGLFLSFVACDELSCEEEGDVVLNAGLYYINEGTVVDTTMDSISIVYATINDSYVDEEASAQILSFFLSDLTDTTQIVIEYIDNVRDTVNFYYTRELFIESYTCGFINNYILTEVDNTTNKMDSIRIKKKLVEYGEDENITIYF